MIIHILMKSTAEITDGKTVLKSTNLTGFLQERHRKKSRTQARNHSGDFVHSETTIHAVQIAVLCIRVTGA